MLKVKNLKSGYDGMEVLRGTDLRIKLSEIVAIIGPNGSGKSTLLKSVFNLADEIIVMDAGKCIARGSSDEIKNNQQVKEAYLGQ